MVHRDPQIAARACSTLRTLLAADAVGDGSLAREAVQLVADLIKRRKCNADPQVVRVLLQLSLNDAVASDVKSGSQSQTLKP